MAKNWLNATNMTLHPLVQTLWGYIKKYPVEINQINAGSAQCDFESSYGNALSRHLRKVKEKSNKCNQCDYATSEASNLRIHFKTHTREKFKKFDFVSSHADNLRKHLKTRSGEKLNKCNQCDFASYQAETLRKRIWKL